jgi:hypothetical protein
MGLALINLLAMVFAAQPQSSSYALDWKALDAAFTQYVNNPSNETSRAISGLLPLGGRVKRSANAYDVDTTEKIYSQLNKIDRRVRSGRPDALEVAFALFEISDGAFSEELSDMLGASVEQDPHSFLMALKVNRKRISWSCALPIYLDQTYVDAPASRLHRAILKRKMAIASVRDPVLSEERACVLKELEGELENIERSMSAN